MRPAVYYYLVQAQPAGLHHRAQRDTLARAARRARCPQRRPGHPAPALLADAARRMLTVLRARRPQPTH